MSAENHTRSLVDPNAATPRMFAQVSDKLGEAGGGLVIGEWSGALNPGSIKGVRDEVKNYIAAQLDLYEKHCGGWFFWTYKKQHRGDSGWCFKDAVEAGTFPPFVGLKAKRATSGDSEQRNKIRDSLRDRALGNHPCSSLEISY